MNTDQELILTIVPPIVICRTCSFIKHNQGPLHCKNSKGGRVSSMHECPLGIWTRYNEYNSTLQHWIAKGSQCKSSVKVVEYCDKDEFTARVDELLEQGYRVSSTSCGFADSEKYDFCNIYQAILVK